MFCLEIQKWAHCFSTGDHAGHRKVRWRGASLIQFSLNQWCLSVSARENLPGRLTVIPKPRSHPRNSDLVCLLCSLGISVFTINKFFKHFQIYRKVSKILQIFQRYYVPLTQFTVLLTFYITTVQLSQLRNQHCYSTID